MSAMELVRRKVLENELLLIAAGAAGRPVSVNAGLSPEECKRFVSAVRERYLRVCGEDTDLAHQFLATRGALTVAEALDVIVEYGVYR